MKGFFITFEGIEGSGKSTQVGLLGSRFREEGYQVMVTREPGGTRIGELVRNITHGRENVELTAAAEACLMAADRAQHVRELIRPALEADKIVVADRFLDSSLAYQGFGRELGLEIIEQLNKLAIDDVYPDLTVFLDLPPEAGFARRNNSNKIDRLDLQQKDFYERVYQGYKKLAEKYKDRYLVVDSSRAIEEAAKTIWDEVRKRVPLIATK